MEIRLAGRRVFAATGGRPFDAALPTVAFLHGAGMDHTVWGLQTRWFAHHGRGVLAFDLPGHGRSEGPALDRVPDMAAWLLDALDALGVTRAALVGHSMGGAVALAAAARGGARIRALALLGVTPALAVHPDLLAAAAAGDARAGALICTWGYGARAQLGGHRAPGLWMVGGGRTLLASGDPATLAADLAACAAYADGLADAARVRAATVLVQGAEDRMTPPAKARDLARAIEGARVVTIVGAGHMMMIERPDETLAALAGAV